MGSLGDGHDKNNPDKNNLTVDLSDTETQSLSGGDFTDEDIDELPFLHGTMPFEDTLPLEDDFETQAVNLGGETQVVNLGGETQVLDYLDCVGGETQVLDYLDCVENNGTQLLNDCDTEVIVDTDDEGSGRTEVLCDTEEVSDDSSVKRAATSPVDQDNMLCTALQKNVSGLFQAETRALSNEECSSGSAPRGFTSLRAASMRASGLAARNMAFKGTNSGSCSIVSESHYLKQHSAEHDATPVMRESTKSVEEIDQGNTTGEYVEQMKGLSNENKCRVGRSAVRKLFTEDTLAETKGLDDNMNNADSEAELPQLLASENELAGLSYVDSQEPGESSQANALDFVDKFLKVNVEEFDQEGYLGRSIGGKSKHVSSAKGTQSLAKSANLLSSAGKRGIFDWDNSREDEGGGEFFRKKKEAFFDKGNQRRRSFKQPQKPRCLDSKSGGAGEEEKELDIHDQTISLVHSNSGLMLHNRKVNDESTKLTEAKFGKNLIKEFDEQFNTGPKDGAVETGPDTDMPDMMNIGLDTQLAAEAMEALCFGVGGGTEVDYDDANQGAKNLQMGSSKGETKNRARRSQTSLQKRVSSNSGVITRQSKQTKRTATKLSKESSKSSPKRPMKVRKQLKKAYSDASEHFPTNGNENLSEVPFMSTEKRKGGKTLKINDIDENIRCQVTVSSGRMPVKKRRMQGQPGTCTPIACRTRQCMGSNQAKRGDASSGLIDWMNMAGSGGPKDKRKRCRTGVDAFAKDKSIEVDACQHEQSDLNLSDTTNAVKVDTLEYPRRKRTTRQRLSAFGQEANGQSVAGSERSQTDAISISLDVVIKRRTRSSVNLKAVNINGSAIAKDVVDNQVAKHSIGKSGSDIISSAKGAEVNANIEASPCKPSASACTTPVNCVTPINEASPICMGDEYLKQSCRKNLSKLSLMKEINSLIASGREPSSPIKDSRRRREMASVQVLFSRHLDGEIIKHQKKILARLGASVASSMSDASHFIADEFVRTRNMLEAIAFGKPVVTHLWLESCGQANCLIDERNYILRDAKKEKEFGFSLPVSLARACKHPLLQGQRVFITPNTKPGKEIVASLVKAVHGLAVERIGRSALKDDKIPDDLLVLSCEEDYEVCVPFLEKGAEVYSSELLLNGIVTQKLEYERHRLFADHVKKTRSTIWLRKDDNHFQPVARCK